MRLKPFIPLFISLLVWMLFPEPASSAQEPDAKMIYADMPIEVQLLIADIKLDELVQGAQSGGETAKAQKLQEAKALLKEALRKYEYYRTGDKKILAENWGFNWAPPRPDFPSLAKSPLSLLEHIWIGYDMAVQLRSGIMVAPVQYSAAQAELHESLDDSVGLMQKCIQAVESAGGWIVHWSSDARLMISAPPEFQRTSPLENDLLRLLKSKPDGSPLAVVFVGRSSLDAGERDMTPERYRGKKIEKIRQRFPDMSAVEIGESGAAAESWKATFSYQYTWKGDPIKALVHLHRIGDGVYDVNVVSIAGSFDRREADRIARSFLRR